MPSPGNAPRRRRPVSPWQKRCPRRAAAEVHSGVPDQHRQLLRHRPRPPPLATALRQTSLRAGSKGAAAFGRKLLQLAPGEPARQNAAVLPPVEGRQGHAARARELLLSHSRTAAPRTDHLGGVGPYAVAARLEFPAGVPRRRVAARTPTPSRSPRSRARRVTSTARSGSASPAGWRRCPRGRRRCGRPGADAARGDRGGARFRRGAARRSPASGAERPRRHHSI